MDRNNIIGFILLIALASGYFLYSNHEQSKFEEQKTADSIALAGHNKAITQEQIGDELTLQDALIDSTLPKGLQGKKEIVTITNGTITLDISTQGAHPVNAALEGYKTYVGDQLSIFKGEENKLFIAIPSKGETILSDQLFFTPEVTTLDDGSQHLRMTSELEGDKKVEISYTLPKQGYMMNANIRLVGFQNEMSTASSIPLTWTTVVPHTEKSLKNERMNAQVHYRFDDGDHDYFTVQRTNSKNIDKGIQWMGVKSQFFNSTIIGDNNFKNGEFNGIVSDQDSSYVMNNTSKLAIPVTVSNDFSFGFRWYLGPNDYKTLKSYDIDMDEMIPLGFGVFFFVKYISKWIIIPLFDFLSGFIGNFGLVIICLTLIIRVCLSFFTYKSQLSSAKMRVLKPEIDALRAKYGDNQQQMGMEQMKLYKTAGVNPLGGCLPMLLQMPFLLSMYYFFPTAVQLRQKSFLWADDLSTYDSIFSWTQNIPLLSSVYGNHISLFTLLMTVTSLILALYSRNMNNAAAAGGGNEMNMVMLKYMPYIMPVLFLGWFNGMAAGLTFYYTFSNIISIAQQFVIQKFLINEDKIHEKIQQNKNKPAGTSKWQEKLEEMQKLQTERMKQKK